MLSAIGLRIHSCWFVPAQCLYMKQVELNFSIGLFEIALFLIFNLKQQTLESDINKLTHAH